MKNLIKNTTIILILVTIFVTNANAQRNVEEVEIKSSVLCGTCEKIITETLAFERGIRSVDVDIKNKLIKVRYNARRTDVDQIREAISKAGYDADDVKADVEAYKKLPFCCRAESGVH